MSKGKVEGVLKSMQREKIPGPDGWTLEFFQHFIDLLGDELTGVVEEARENGLVYEPFISTFFTLITKMEDLSYFE